MLSEGVKMRIVSQNRCFDIPYDRFMIGMIGTDAQIEVYAQDEKGVNFILGDYKNTARAKTETKKLRIAYSKGQKIYYMGEDEK